MKKKARTSNNNPFYSNEPAVSRTKIADQGMGQNSSLGNAPPKMVDKKPGRLSGVAGFAGGHKPASKKPASPAFTAPLKSGSAKPTSFPKQASLKASGHPQAHRLGSVGSIKLKV